MYLSKFDISHNNLSIIVIMNPLINNITRHYFPQIILILIKKRQNRNRIIYKIRIVEAKKEKKRESLTIIYENITYDNLTIEFKISQLEFNWGNNVEEWSIRRHIIAEYHPAEDIPPLWLNYDEIPCTKVAVAKYLANSSTITPVGKKFLWKRNSNRRVAIQ